MPGFDPEEPRREVTADFTLELVDVPPELPVFVPEDPRRELTADFTLELLDVPPLDDDLDPRAEDTADLILEAVLLTLLEVELLRLELEPLLELLLLELLLLLLVLLWASIPATSRMRKRRSKGSLIAKQRQEQTVAPATVCWLIDLQIPDTSSCDTHSQSSFKQRIGCYAATTWCGHLASNNLTSRQVDKGRCQQQKGFS